MLLRFAPARHTVALARLAVLGAVIAMVVPPFVGAFSDRLRRLGTARQPFVLTGSLVNVVGLLGMAWSSDEAQFGLAFAVATLGQNAAFAAYEALIPDFLPEERFGRASAAMGIASLFGSVVGLAVAGIFGPLLSLYAMALTTAVAALVTGTLPEAPAVTQPPRRHLEHRVDFLLVFIGRLFILFGLTLLMTFVLYFLHDVLRLANPTGGTALAAGVALFGSFVSSYWAGQAADRFRRSRIAALSGLPMALAALLFALVPSLRLLVLAALLYGLGYGAYLSSDWALMLSALPNRRSVARDLGVLNIATNLPAVLAPAAGAVILTSASSAAAGYHLLFLTASAAFLLGSLLVLPAGEAEPLPFPSACFAFLVAILLALYVRLAFRVHFFGRLPRRRPATLVLGNHQHEIEGMIVPVFLYLGGPWCRPIYSAASRRMFEPGFLYERSPRWLRPFTGWIPLPKILQALGVHPIENMPRSRSIRSYAYAVYRRHGDLPLRVVFHEDVLEELARRSGQPLAEARLRTLWGRLLPWSQALLTPRALREPYRTELRESLRHELEADLAALASVLGAGGTLYLTPEGRLSADGRLGRLREALHRLLPAARHVYAAASVYDPFLPGRLTFYCRLVGPLEPTPEAVRQALIRARPVTQSQLVATALDRLPTRFTAAEFDAALSEVFRALPSEVFLAPSATHRPDGQAILCSLRRRGLVEADREGHYWLAANRTDPRFPMVPDIIRHQANILAETLEQMTPAAHLPSRAPKGLS